MYEQISRLPYEIREYIIYVGGLELAVVLECDYVIRKITKEQKLSWKEILKMDTNVIKYFYAKKYKYDELIQFNNTMIPYRYTAFLDDAITQNDTNKLEILDSIVPRLICTTDVYEYAKNRDLTKVVEWININRPATFLHLRTKHTKCLSYYTWIMPKDVKCRCKQCGGDNRGFEFTLN